MVDFQRGINQLLTLGAGITGLANLSAGKKVEVADALRQEQFKEYNKKVAVANKEITGALKGLSEEDQTYLAENELTRPSPISPDPINKKLAVNADTLVGRKKLAKQYLNQAKRAAIDVYGIDARKEASLNAIKSFQTKGKASVEQKEGFDKFLQGLRDQGIGNIEKNMDMLKDTYGRMKK